MQSGNLCNLGPVETELHNRKRLVDRSAPAWEFLCLKCLHLKSKNFVKYQIHKYGLKNKLPSQQLNFPTVTGFSRLWGALRPPRPPIIYVPAHSFLSGFCTNDTPLSVLGSKPTSPQILATIVKLQISFCSFIFFYVPAIYPISLCDV